MRRFSQRVLPSTTGAARALHVAVSGDDRPTPGESLQSIHPTVAQAWCAEKNGGLTPADVRPDSCRVVWWKPEGTSVEPFERPILAQVLDSQSDPQSCLRKSEESRHQTVVWVRERLSLQTKRDVEREILTSDAIRKAWEDDMRRRGDRPRSTPAARIAPTQNTCSLLKHQRELWSAELPHANMGSPVLSRIVVGDGIGAAAPGGEEGSSEGFGSEAEQQQQQQAPPTPQPRKMIMSMDDMDDASPSGFDQPNTAASAEQQHQQQNESIAEETIPVKEEPRKPRAVSRKRKVKVEEDDVAGTEDAPRQARILIRPADEQPTEDPVAPSAADEGVSAENFGDDFSSPPTPAADADEGQPRAAGGPRKVKRVGHASRSSSSDE